VTAGDVRYGRRGGGWVDGDPTAWRDEFAAIRAANGGELRTSVDLEGAEVVGQLDLFGEAS
jgi:hypothetical protein